MASIRTRHHIRNRRIMVRPGWVLPRAVVDIDFANNRAFGANIRGSGLTCTRSSTADYVDDLQGVYSTRPAAVPRISNKGLLVEGTATNVVLRNRDHTQAAWVKVSMTTALDQVGIDGTANSASSLTATGANGTSLQSITVGSSSRMGSAFVRRITGTGTINMTIDGVTYTAITLTSNWSRVNVPLQTLTAVVMGFQIVTSGDAIAVDFVQNEVGPNMTSPILTAGVAVARSADVVSLTGGPPLNLAKGCSLFAQGVPVAAVAFASSQSIAGISDGTTNNRLILFRTGTTAIESGLAAAGGVTILSGSSAAVWTAGVRGKAMVAYQPDNGAGAGFGDHANTFNATTSGAATSAGTMAALTALQFGTNGGAAGPFFGYVERVAVFDFRVLNGRMRDLTL